MIREVMCTDALHSPIGVKTDLSCKEKEERFVFCNMNGDFFYYDFLVGQLHFFKVLKMVILLF